MGRVQRPRLTAPLRHEAQVAMSAFSPDGMWLATAGDDRTACVWPANAANATTAAFGLPSFLSDADVRLLAELLACRRVDAVGGLVGLTAPEWQKHYNDLLMKYPERFFPPPTKAAFDAELSRVPADPARLKAAGEWFYRRGESASAGELLDRARRSGAMVDQALIARAFWLGGRPTLAETLFERAAAEETTASVQVYLRQCAAAVKREAGVAPTSAPTSRPATSSSK